MWGLGKKERPKPKGVGANQEPQENCEPAFGLYGKLPCSKEFIRISCYEGVGLQFKGWIDRGYDHWSATGQDSFASLSRLSQSIADNTSPELAPVHRWLYSPLYDPNSILSVALQSNDASGFRAFPFSFFLKLPTNYFEGLSHPTENSNAEEVNHSKLSESATAVRNLRNVVFIWNGLVQKLPEILECENSQALKSLLSSWDAQEFIKQHTVSSSSNSSRAIRSSIWVDSLFPDSSLDCFVRALWRLRFNIQFLKSGKKVPALQLVRVPLVKELCVELQLNWWHILLKKCHPSYQGQASVYLSSTPESTNTTSAFMSYRTPVPEDFLLGFGEVSNGTKKLGGKYLDLIDGQESLPSDGFSSFYDQLEVEVGKMESFLFDGLDPHELSRLLIAD